MPDIEELEHRITRLEALYEDVLREKPTAIAARLDRLDTRLDQLYEKTERDKTGTSRGQENQGLTVQK